MFFRNYPEKQISPKQVRDDYWLVWCAAGAREVLASRDHERLLAEKPTSGFLINFANGAYADIAPEHPLWQDLADVAQHYTIKVFQLNISGGYVPWTGRPQDLRRFDAITISAKPS